MSVNPEQDDRVPQPDTEHMMVFFVVKHQVQLPQYNYKI